MKSDETNFVGATLYRASILDFPQATAAPDADFRYHKDGYLVTRNGSILAVGAFEDAPKELINLDYIDYTGQLLVPGLIDTHVHFPQTEMIASYGKQLLEWLKMYTFPTEQKFADEGYARTIAHFFLNQLLANGTTTAMIYPTVHVGATNALFDVSDQLNMCNIAGKVCMDRHCPEPLKDSPERAQYENVALIEKWHNHGRQRYALTPRFAPTSTDAQLAVLGELAQQYPDVYIQTHLSENTAEIAWVNDLFPHHQGYLDVYDAYHLVTDKSVFGHCLHLTPDEWLRIKQANASIAFCPSSNLFLGSGLFDLNTAREHNIDVMLASDVGGGSSFNMLRIFGEAYKICQLNHTRLSPLQGLYHMTQGSAIGLHLDHKIGNLNPGTDADFIVLNPAFSELSKLRTEHSIKNNRIDAPEDVIFALSMLADERAIAATYVAGKCVNRNANTQLQQEN